MAARTDIDETSQPGTMSEDSLLRRVASAPPLRPPTWFKGTARFQPIRRIGAGSFGVVYEALDRETDSRVALKVLKRLTPESLYRFKGEFRALPDVTHPNVIRLDRLHSEGDDWFFTMELIDGVDFLTWVRADSNRLVEAFQQLASGVSKLHALGIVHRDLKPPNVLVDSTGRVVLVDFGLSGTSIGDEAPSSCIAGTPLYMAPEQALLGATAQFASDWYSVGVMLYEALTGQRPFEGSSLEIFAAKGRGTPRHPQSVRPDAPEGLSRLCMELLSIEPEARPAGRAVQERLSRMSTGLSSPPLERVEQQECFVGRHAELAQLHQLWCQLDHGRPVVALVAGPSGIGKTALLGQFVREVCAHEADLALFRGRCYEQESVPYKALDGVIDEVTRYLGRMSTGEVERILPDDPTALTRLFPVLARVPCISLAHREVSGHASGVDRLRAIASLRELFLRLGQRRPILVVIDDLHWGDADSANVLIELLESPEAPRLFLAATYREENCPESECLRLLTQRLGVRSRECKPPVFAQVPLGNLDPDSARQIANLTLPSPNETLARLIAEESQGLPFFIRHLAQYEDSIRPVDARSSSEDARSLLERAISSRIDGLPVGSRRILEVLAVAGQPISRRSAFDAAGDTSLEIQALATLRTERLCRIQRQSSVDQLETYHDRIRQIVANQMTIERKAETHRALASSLETEGADAGIIARHFHLGGNDHKAWRYAVAAGDRAAEALAFDAAAQHYCAASAWCTQDDAVRTDLIRRQAHALASAGRGAEAGPLFLSLARSESGNRAFELKRMGVDQLLVSGNIEQGTIELRRLALEVGLRFPANQAMAFLLMLWSLISLGLRHILSMKFIATEASPADLRRADVAAIGFRGLSPVEPAEAGHFAVAELYFARKAADRKRVALSLARVGAGVLGPGPRILAQIGERLLETAHDLASAIGDQQLQGTLLVARSANAFWGGKWGESLAFADSGIVTLSVAAGTAGHEWNLAHVVAVRSLEELGRWREAQKRSERMLADADARGDLYAQCSARLSLAMEALTDGNPTRAVELSDAAAASWTASTYTVQQLYALRVRLLAQHATGNPGSALNELCAEWPKLRAGMHLSIKASLIDCLALRGSLAVACASNSASARVDCLKLAERSAAALARTRRLDAQAHAAALRAGVARTLGQLDRERAHWGEAERYYAEAEMSAHVLGVRILRSSSEDSDRVNFDSELRALGIANPRNWVNWCIPGASAHPVADPATPPSIATTDSF